MKPVCITFAGSYGCSKSPVAQYLSCELGWPRLENDVIRKEVKEDAMSPELDEDEFARRVVERGQRLAAQGQSFIYDASVDRQWRRLLSSIEAGAYSISFDFSRGFYKRLIDAKQYDLSERAIDNYLADHARFVATHSDAVICRITDDTFANRLALALSAAHQFMGDKTPSPR